MRTQFFQTRLATLFAMMYFSMLQPSTSQSWNKMATIYGDYFQDFSGSVVSLNAAGNSIAIQSFSQGSNLDGKTTLYSSNDNGTWSETYKVLYTLDSFTARVKLAYSGDESILAVGAHFNVTLYERNVTDGSWTSVKGPMKPDDFSSTITSVDLSNEGNVLAISSYSFGKSSYTMFHRKNSEGWENMGESISSSLTNRPGIVSISGNGMRIAISEAFEIGTTRIYQYNETSATWEQMGDSILGNSDGDLFGKAMAISRDGSTVAIGAPFHDEIAGNQTKLNIGSVTVYRYDPDTRQWKQKGESLKGKEEFGAFGNSLDISADGNILVVGNSDSLQRYQYVRVFEFVPETSLWVQLGNDFLDDGSLKSYFGFSVSLSDDGSILAIGSPGATKPRNRDDNSTLPMSNAGVVLIYRYGNKQSKIFVDTLITSGATLYGMKSWGIWHVLSILLSAVFLFSLC